jgi:hypothetical protein
LIAAGSGVGGCHFEFSPHDATAIHSGNQAAQPEHSLGAVLREAGDGHRAVRPEAGQEAALCGDAARRLRIVERSEIVAERFSATRLAGNIMSGEIRSSI